MIAGRVIVIGASSGATPAIEALLRGLGANLPAAVLLVRHVPPYSAGHLLNALGRGSPLPVTLGTDAAPVEPGRVYVAPVDRHLLVDAAHMYLSRGLRENRARPAIDPLFRSAALSYGAHAVGVVLSGRLDDGSAGLLALKQSGAITVVQDPADARCAEMPCSAMHHADADYCLPAAEIGPLLSQLVRAHPPETTVTPPRRLMVQWRKEIDALRRHGSDISTVETLGELAPASCPECGGPLWQLSGGVHRFRCHTGHAFTAQHLAAGLGEAAEEALWAALRALEERARMLRRIADHDAANGIGFSMQTYHERAAEAERHVASLRLLLLSGLPANGGR